MTAGRLVLLAALSMMLTGGAVYALAPTSPRATALAEQPEPVAPEPVAPEPVAPEPVAPEPVAPEPVAPEPVAPAPSVLPTASALGSAKPKSTGSPGAPPEIATAASVVRASAGSEAPGMVPEGPILTGALRTGGTLAHSFTLSPGKCYAAYGVGLGIGRDLFGGVRELDLSIAMLSPAGSTVLARDATAGPVASLGTRGNCVKWPYPIAAQGRFVVRVAAGDGVAAAQLYVK